MRLYNFQTIDKLVTDYSNLGGQAIQTNDGVLGSGDWILTGLKFSFVVKEVYLNEWSSGHKVIKYKNLPKKYQAILN